MPDLRAFVITTHALPDLLREHLFLEIYDAKKSPSAKAVQNIRLSLLQSSAPNPSSRGTKEIFDFHFYLAYPISDERPTLTR